MAPLLNLVSRSNTSAESGPHIGIIVGYVASGVVLVLLFASVAVVLVRRRRQRRNQSRNVSVEQGRMSPESSEFGHKSYSRHPSSDGVSMSSPVESKPLWLYAQSPPQQYHVPESTLSHHTNYHCVASDDGRGEIQHHAEPLSNAVPFMRESMTPQEARARYLPPLLIPFSPPVSTSNHQSTNPIAAIDTHDSGASTPTSIETASSESLYSLPSASTHMHYVVSNSSPPPLPPIPSLHLQTQDLQPQQDVQRVPTRVLGHLIKARAKRNSEVGPGPSRSLTNTSRIERSNSIISVPSPTDPTADFTLSAPSNSRPLRQKSWKAPHVPMEPLVEAPDSAIATSFRNPSSSTISPPTTSHSQKSSLTSAFNASVHAASTTSHASFTTAPSEQSRSEEFHAIDLYNDTLPLKIASKAYRDRDRAKLNIQTRLDGSVTSLRSGAHVQDTNSEPSSRPGRAHLRDQIVVQVPSALRPARMSSSHATVEVGG